VSVFSQANHRPGWWAHAGHGGWFGHHRAHDPELVGERVGFVTDWLLGRINASEEQRQQVKTVLQEALNDLSPLREQHLVQRQALLEVLKQQTIDRQALEQLRQAKLQLMETASSRLAEALADIADVLTPEQRAALTAFAARWHH
jgi:Spy/CpxP family protein refolding chaperone